jgi:hypothetical protein
MLFLRESHEVIGAREREFEAAFREVWWPALGASPRARLLYYLRHAHGTGPSYHVVTWTAIQDGVAFEELVRRVDAGDLRAASRALDDLRHDVTGKLYVPLPWSPLRAVDLAAVPTSLAAEREAVVFMEDTVWPHEGRLEEYVETAGSHYAREMREHDARGHALLRVEASFRTAFGSHRRREIVLWQRVVQPKGLLPLLTREVPDAYLQPGRWMHDALALRDRWESRLLRSAAWSPWP